MALSKVTLAAALESDIKNINAETDDTRKLLAEAIANTVIDHFIANAVITVASGIAVATTGSAVAQTGVTTTPGTGTVS